MSSDRSASNSAAAEPEARARSEILDAFERYAATTPAALVSTAAAFSDQYNSGAVDASEETKGWFPSISPSTLLRWRRARRRHGLEGLAGRRRGRKRPFLERTPDVRSAIADYLKEAPTASSREIREHLEERFKGEDLPSRRTIQRFVKGYFEVEGGHDRKATRGPAPSPKTHR